MIEIVDGARQPERLPDLLALFRREWSDFDRPLVEERTPAPLLALSGSGELLGGLAFTVAPTPDGKSDVVWINAVVVVPEHRGRGLATDLVRKAIEAAASIGIAELHVYSAVPALYTKLGWTVVQSDGPSSVLVRESD